MAKNPARRVGKKGQEVEKLNLKIIPSLEPRFGRVYSNYVQVSHSPWDFTIRFCDIPSGGDIPMLREGDKLTVPSVIDIVIVPGLIPGIIKALQGNYEKYLKNIEEMTFEEETPEA